MFSRTGRRIAGGALALGLLAAGVSGSQAAVGAAASSLPDSRLPAGFAARDAQVNGIRMHYVVGGSGPTLVLLHGYPQTSREWFGVMPELARHYTVIAPDLRGAGGSSAPAGGYDKVTMAADVHALLGKLGRDRDINLVGHDIGTMVSYAYAATYRGSVRRLALTEAPIPDRTVYSYPSLTQDGPGFWNFGFFSLRNGLPENTIDGHEETWVAGFMDWLTVNKTAVTREDTDAYAAALHDDAHLKASFEWFRAFPEDNQDVERLGRKKLTVPVLAVGARSSLGDQVGEQAKTYARHVRTAVVENSGHWIWEEQPAATTALLLDFLDGGGQNS
ncbi:alpha/beta fold hydrolase [Kineosporia succinea]|uniref:Pimeloyl-ACP methyl ester carboxylesterase n=1 Tax=Kineosporia succinea TaxID=84632 RepID=A0ABT9P8L3_9ACTN|nr:alpha/beta hydrolase [Kineosporia succinea]MDP9829039.1 pimeloyl-ACP methyl ester carboxylesterase [Kineosporia succinea]